MKYNVPYVMYPEFMVAPLLR